MATTTDNHTKVLAFIAGAVAREGHQQAVKIALIFTPPQGFRTEPIKSWTRKDDPDYFADPTTGKPNHVYTEQLCNEVMELAENFADSYGAGRHRFVLHAYQHLGERQACPFVIAPGFSGDESDTQAMTEATANANASGHFRLEPTQSGLTLQLMRHLENRDRGQREMLQGFLQAMNHHAQQMREENQDLRAQLAAKDKERMEWLTTIEEARSKDHDRQIEAQKVVSADNRKDYAMKKIMGLLPVVVSQWGSSKNKNGGKPTPLALAVGKLVDSLTDEQKDQIEASLDIEQRIMLAEAMRVAESNPSSVLLPSIVNDMVQTLRTPQVQAIMGCLKPEQASHFVNVMKLAQAVAEAEAEKTGNGDPSSAKQTNGAAGAEAPS